MSCEQDAVASIQEEAIMHNPKIVVQAITVNAAILAICTAVALVFLYACNCKTIEEHTVNIAKLLKLSEWIIRGLF